MYLLRATKTKTPTGPFALQSSYIAGFRAALSDVPACPLSLLPAVSRPQPITLRPIQWLKPAASKGRAVVTVRAGVWLQLADAIVYKSTFTANWSVQTEQHK